MDYLLADDAEGSALPKARAQAKAQERRASSGVRNEIDREDRKEQARVQLTEAISSPLEKGKADYLLKAINEGTAAGLEDYELTDARAALDAAKQKEALMDLQEASRSKANCKEKIALLDAAIDKATKAGVSSSAIATGQELLEKERAKVNAQEDCKKACQDGDIKGLEEALQAAKDAGLTEAESTEMAAATALLSKLIDARKEHARDGVREALMTGRIFDLKAAIDAGEKAGLLEEDLKQVRDMLTKEEKKIDAREQLERSLHDYERSCARKTCCCVCDACCCGPSTEKMDALTKSLASAEAAGLKEVEMSESKQALAMEMMYHAGQINLATGARNKYEQCNKAVKFAEANDVDDEVIMNRTKVVMEEAHTQWKEEAKLQLKRAIDDEDIPPTLGERALACMTCGIVEKERPEFHKIKALKIAIQEGEDAGLHDDELEDARLTLEDCEGEVSVRMNILEDKIFQLEAQLLLQEDQPGTCWKFCTCIYDITRTIPFFPIGSFLVTLAGLYVISEHNESIKRAVETVSVWRYPEQVVENSGSILAFVLVVDLSALIVAFPATGRIREWIYGKRNSGSVEVIQCLLGPCTVGITLVAVATSFLLVMACICVLLPYLTVLGLGSAASDATPRKTESLATALANWSVWGDYVTETRQNEIATSLSSYCTEDHRLITAEVLSFVYGLGLVAISQAWTQCLTITNLQKIWMTNEEVHVSISSQQERERQEVLKLTQAY